MTKLHCHQQENIRGEKKPPVARLLLILFTLNMLHGAAQSELPQLRVSENQRFLSAGPKTPFFWLGDTGWLLFTELTREEADAYFSNRMEKGFNVIQAVLLFDVRDTKNAYGDEALVQRDISRPLVTPGYSFNDQEQYDYWDHVDYLLDLAASKGLYLAMVPVWGLNVRRGYVDTEQAGKYAAWLTGRYGGRTNLIWVNGGDINGSDSISVWNTIGDTLHRHATQLVTFHPRGQQQSSVWFQEAAWLDFNMFQSGHRRYNQVNMERSFGEDNWKYVTDDYGKRPVKPTLDGEPSYEGIPQGLRDLQQPRWQAMDVRRYAYWSVFAGACGFTYGHNSVWQFHRENNENPAFGADIPWETAMEAPGASQMKHLKQLILGRPFFERVPAPELIAGPVGERYDYLAATRGNDFVYIYTFNGRNVPVNMDNTGWKNYRAQWFNPRNGSWKSAGKGRARGRVLFDPPGDERNGNDYVLVLDRK